MASDDDSSIVHLSQKMRKIMENKACVSNVLHISIDKVLRKMKEYDREIECNVAEKQTWNFRGRLNGFCKHSKFFTLWYHC